MKNMILALVMVALVPTLALAGGGSKGGSTSNIEFTNDGAQRLGVLIDAPAGFDPKKATLSEFRAQGGRFLDPGESTIYDKLKSGRHKIGAAFLFINQAKVGINATRSVTVPKKGTVQVGVTGNELAAPTLDVSGEGN